MPSGGLQGWTTRQLYKGRARFGFDRPELESDVAEVSRSDSCGVNEPRSLVVTALDDPDEKVVSMAFGADRSEFFFRLGIGIRTTTGPGTQKKKNQLGYEILGDSQLT